MQAEEALKKIESLGIEFSVDSFFTSLRNGDRTVVELFLAAGLSPDSRDREGNAAVLVASRLGHSEIGRLLLTQGASPEPLLVRELKEKDKWDKIQASSSILSFISGLLIAGVGGYFTYSYNQRQIDLNRIQAGHEADVKEEGARVLELDAIQKFIPLLTSTDEKGKAAALTAIHDLAHPTLAEHLAELFKGQGSVQYLQQAVASSDSRTQQAAKKALSTIAATGHGLDSQLAYRALSLEQVRASVVRISPRLDSNESASAFFVTGTGYLLTAARLFRENVTNVQVILGGRFLAGKLIDINRTLDLAIVKVEEDDFNPIRLSTSSIDVGSEVSAIGYAADIPGRVTAIDAQHISFNVSMSLGILGALLHDAGNNAIGIVIGKEGIAATAIRSEIVVEYLQSKQVLPHAINR
jgi:Trypsin-like peptidase domain